MDLVNLGASSENYRDSKICVYSDNRRAQGLCRRGFDRPSSGREVALEAC